MLLAIAEDAATEGQFGSFTRWLRIIASCTLCYREGGHSHSAMVCVVQLMTDLQSLYWLIKLINRSRRANNNLNVNAIAQ